VRDVNERLRLGIGVRGPLTTDPLTQAEREPDRGEVGAGDRGEQQRPPPEDREEQPGHDEHKALGADPGKVDEEPVQPADAVVDDPAFEVPVEPDQVGSSCLV